MWPEPMCTRLFTRVQHQSTLLITPATSSTVLNPSMVTQKSPTFQIKVSVLWSQTVELMAFDCVCRIMRRLRGFVLLISLYYYYYSFPNWWNLLQFLERWSVHVTHAVCSIFAIVNKVGTYNYYISYTGILRQLRMYYNWVKCCYKHFMCDSLPS